MSLRQLMLLSACLLPVLGPSGAAACGFFQPDTTTIRMFADDAQFVVLGTLSNAREDTNGGTTDFAITRALKNDPILRDRKTLTIPRYLPVDDPKLPLLWLVFGVVDEQKADVVRAMPVTEAVVAYLAGQMKIDGKDRVALMRYALAYMDHPDAVVAKDAFATFLASTDPQIQEAARAMPAERIRRLLHDERTPRDHLRLYGYLLGNCGDKSDAALLRGMLDRSLTQPGHPLIDGILTGYTLLDREAGWAYIRDLAKNPSASIHARIAALRAVRYFYTTQPDFIPEKDILGVLRLSMDQSDIADIPIEDLRKWRNWSFAEVILSLFTKKEFDAPVVRWCIVRYALQCPDAQARQFIAALRKTNPQLVEDAKDSLDPGTQTVPVKP